MKPLMVVLAAGVMLPLSGCGEQPADAPPEVLLGESVCDHCNMIISDARWATATIVEGPRGAEPRLFDDFNCQANYEAGHPDIVILGRWSHDYITHEWLKTEGAFFLIGPGVRSPMGSNAAAFTSEAEAEAAREKVHGEVFSFEQAWERLAAGGG